MGGAMGLIGIIVNDGLIMVSHLNQISLGRELTMDLLLKGAKDRFRAVILTTVTTVLGMTPTIFGIGGYEPFLVPIVLAVAGGLVFATSLTLIFIPILYLVFSFICFILYFYSSFSFFNSTFNFDT